MTTLADWDREMERMTDQELSTMADHLGALLQWPFFSKAYKGFGLSAVKIILRNEIDRREREGWNDYK